MDKRQQTIVIVLCIAIAALIAVAIIPRIGNGEEQKRTEKVVMKDPVVQKEAIDQESVAVKSEDMGENVITGQWISGNDEDWTLYTFKDDGEAWISFMQDGLEDGVEGEWAIEEGKLALRFNGRTTQYPYTAKDGLLQIGDVWYENTGGAF